MPNSLSTAQMLIALIDEMHRLRGRLTSASVEFHASDEPAGLAMTVLTAVVMAAYPPTVPQIGRSLGYPRQTIQRQADDLAHRGLIAWVDNPDHKRAQRLVGTDAGNAIQSRANARSLVWAATITEGVDAEKLADAITTLHQIRARIEDRSRQTALHSKP